MHLYFKRQIYQLLKKHVCFNMSHLPKNNVRNKVKRVEKEIKSNSELFKTFKLPYWHFTTLGTQLYNTNL